MSTETRGIRDWRTLRVLRRLRRRLWKLVIWFVIGSAVLVSIGRLLAPHADAFRPVAERFLSNALKQPVRIERIEARWPKLSPQITLIGFSVGRPGEPLLAVDRARLELKLYNVVQPSRNSFELIVLGLDLLLIQEPNGQWSWRLDRGGTFAQGWERAISAGDVLLRDSGIRILPLDLPDLVWKVPEARLSRDDNDLRVRLDALPEGGAGEMLEARFVLNMPESRLDAVSGFAQAADIGLSNIALQSTAESVIDLRVQMQWWLDWKRGDGARLYGKVDLHSLSDGGIAGRISSRFELDGIWHENELAVELDARELGDSDSVLIDSLAYGNRNDRHGVAADKIELDYLHALLAPWLGHSRYWPDGLSGAVTGLRVGVNDDGSVYRAEGRVEDLDARLVDPSFSLALDRAELSLAGDRLLVRPSGSATVAIPELYPQPVEFSRLSGTAGWSSGRVELEGFSLRHPEFEAIVDGAVELSGEEPFVDLVVDLPRLSSQAPRRWLPLRGIGPNTRKWLDEALLEVGSAQAVTTLFGKPSKWKTHVPAGSVNSRAVFSGLELAYAKNWPVAENIAGRVEFSGESMHAVADSLRVAGVTLQVPGVHIAQARNAEIELHLQAVDAGAGALADLAKALPLAGVDRAMERMEWQGGASAEASVWFPVKRREDWRLVGAIDLAAAGLELPEQGIGLSAISGALPFTRERLGPADLAARMLDQPTSLELNSRFRPAFNLSVQGRFPVRGLLPANWKAGLGAVTRQLEGSALFEIEFEAVGENPSDTGLRLGIASSLEGVGSSLPEPLKKAPEDIWPLEIEMPFGDLLKPVRFGIENRLSGEWLMLSNYWQLGLGFGDVSVDLPMAENFIVEGALPSLDFDQWFSLIGELNTTGLQLRPGEGSTGLSGWLDLEIGDLRVQQGSLGNVGITLNREGNYWRLNTAGNRVAGSIRFPASGFADRSIVADMSRLAWPQHKRDRQPSAKPPSILDPARVPALDILVRDLRWGELDLGEFRLSSHQEERGLQIEQVSSRRDGLELTGSGSWLQYDRGPFSRMRIRLATADLGETLTQAGFDLALQRGRAVVELDGRWPGSPLDLSLPRVDGSLEVVVTDGVIPEASPGAGRLLGLMSLNSIPRRLRLDFSDVFGEGLSFDRVAGHFELADGMATTDDVRIDAPAAEVRMRGTTDLKGRTYDQTLIVRPGVGSALPVLGALAGGPVGAAAGAALQQLFSRPLGGISQVRYSVTGDWQQPLIAPVAVERDERDDG